MRPCVYRFFDIDGRLLYIGQSGTLGRRLDHHASQREWFEDIATVSVSHYTTREQAAAVERVAIGREQPLHNHHFIRPRKISKPLGRPVGLMIDVDAYARHARGQRQTNVAARAGISQTMLSKISRGRTRASVSAAARLAAALRCGVGDLFPDADTDAIAEVA